jgi:AraC-like DNA-binding protein
MRSCRLTVGERFASADVFDTPERTPRARRGEGMLRNPAQSRTLAALCDEVGVSVRTIERLFRKDVGIDFESWRRQVRLMKSVELLIAGRPVKEVAFRVGYRQGSAFVEAFRRTFGVAPKAWILALEKLDG